jgi:anti-sigma-K factor RskA
MGHVSNWLHDHHWDAVNNQKADWRIFLLVALVAVAVFVLIMLMFPGSTY